MMHGFAKCLLAAMAAWPVAMAAPGLAAESAPQAARSVSMEDYRRAERFLSWNLDRSVHNAEISHNWIGGADRLWYKRGSDDGDLFMVADARRGTKAPAFDHEAMARALSNSLGKTVDARHLPITRLLFAARSAVPEVVVAGRIRSCDLVALTCLDRGPADGDPAEAASPDGRFLLFIRDHNLWLRERASGAEKALTTDGDADHAYGRQPESSTSEITLRRAGAKMPPLGVFSPDGRKFLTYRLDQSRVKTLSLLQSVPEDGSFRPRVHRYHYPFAGDANPLAELVVADLPSGRVTRVDHAPVAAPLIGPVLAQELFWGADGRKAYLVWHDGSYRNLSLVEIDGETGRTRRLISEDSSVYNLASSLIGERPMVVPLANGDVIWPSERSGRRHLYRHDGRSGRLRNAITTDPLLVREIVRIDETAGLVYFLASGDARNRDPYFRALYRVRLDGRGLTRLTPEDADHLVRTAVPSLIAALQPGATGPAGAGFSPGGAFFVDSYARPDLPTVTVIRDRDGRVVLPLETASLGRDIAASYRPPETFKALAADGVTAIYGSIFKPSGFDASKSYPVIDSIYPGPQIPRVGKRYMSDLYDAQAVAELGFIVVTLDGRGTPFRERAFRDQSYGNMGAAGMLEDHVAVLTELGRGRPYMDMTRVGIYGTSGGGFATVHALFEYPDFFKVGVAAAGNHDQRSYLSMWGETYHGDYDDADYARIASYNNVANFRGKLLIAHGEMDDNVHPANSMRVIDQLIRHGKPFDMLIMPNVNHGMMREPYFVKRLWDYFLLHLKGEEPLPDFILRKPAPPGM